MEWWLLASFGRWEVKLDRVGLVLGVVGNLCLAFLFFPVTRTSSVLPLFGLTSEGSIKYHIWLGHITMVLFTAHGIVYIVYWIIIGRYSEVIKLSSIFRVVITDNDVIYTHLYYVSWPKHLRYQKKKITLTCMPLLLLQLIHANIN